jgi:uncharacterized membrane protein YdjX (TVP38/TMEM64 family)
VLRAYIAGWGPFGPAVYLALVIVEVLVAPIPGTMLYAPGGVIFGGGLGGTLSLAGNVIGAAIACWITRVFSTRSARSVASPTLVRYREQIADRGAWIVFLLRLNPLTSSDLVSYAAGCVGVSPVKVAVGTLAGMAPLCYAQAYVADRVFSVLPGSLWLVAALGLLYAALVVRVVARSGRRSSEGARRQRYADGEGER